MTILDRARGSRRIRIDPGQFADDLAKRMPDLEDTDLGKALDAAGTAISDTIDRAGEAVRNLVSDMEKTGDKVGDKVPDKQLGDLGKRIRSVASRDTVDEVAGRIEQSLPDTDKDRYVRAFERGRVQTRTRYVVVGAAAGIAAATLGVVFLDPKQGQARRDALAQKATAIGKQAAGKVKYAQDRARGIAIERGIVKPDRDPVGVMDAVAAPAWPSAEGPLDQPLDDPQFGAHEALPEDLVGAGQGSDGETATHKPRA